MGRLEGHVALITGAGEGIGLGIARRMAGEGAAIVVAERDEHTGAAAARELQEQFGVGATFVPTDVTDKAQVEAAVRGAVEGHGRLDAVVNNAWGGGTMSRLEHKTDAQMDHGLQMAFWPAYWSMQAAFPVMRDQGRGRIINLCSLNGVNAHPFTAEYNTGKEARPLAHPHRGPGVGPSRDHRQRDLPGGRHRGVQGGGRGRTRSLIAETLRNNPRGGWATPRPTSAVWPCSWPATTPAT